MRHLFTITSTRDKINSVGELKTDMGLVRFPSGTFATKELDLHLGMLASSTVRFIVIP